MRPSGPTPQFKTYGFQAYTAQLRHGPLKVVKIGRGINQAQEFGAFGASAREVSRAFARTCFKVSMFMPKPYKSWSV